MFDHTIVETFLRLNEVSWEDVGYCCLSDFADHVVLVYLFFCSRNHIEIVMLINLILSN